MHIAVATDASTSSGGGEHQHTFGYLGLDVAVAAMKRHFWNVKGSMKLLNDLQFHELPPLMSIAKGQAPRIMNATIQKKSHLTNHRKVPTIIYPWRDWKVDGKSVFAGSDVEGSISTICLANLEDAVHAQVNRHRSVPRALNPQCNPYSVYVGRDVKQSGEAVPSFKQQSKEGRRTQSGARAKGEDEDEDDV